MGDFEKAKRVQDFMDTLSREMEALKKQEINPWDEKPQLPPSRGIAPKPFETGYEKTVAEVTPAFTGQINKEAWDKVALDPVSKFELLSAIHQYTHGHRLFDEWGLGEIVKRGKGVGILLYGPPGTGKTQTANIIAEYLGRELMQKDAADLQGSLAGMSEQFVKAMFKDATTRNAVIFIDECDTLICNRNGAHMMEWKVGIISQLLIGIENFQGIIILATNRLDSLDPALNRRLAAKIELPYPDEKTRHHIWKIHIPEKLPVSKKIDFKKLAKAFILSGGEIKNAVLSAARTASMEECKRVELKHFVLACKQQVLAREAFNSKKQYL